MHKKFRCIIIIVLLAITFISCQICLEFIRNWQNKQRMLANFAKQPYVDLQSFTPLPMNSVIGPLRFYYEQWMKYSNASFFPEIKGTHIIIRIRLKSFIDVYSTNLNTIHNVTLKCYTTSIDDYNHSKLLLLTVRISVLLYPTVKISSHIFHNPTQYNKIRQIKSASLQQLEILLPLTAAENVYYTFSCETDRQYNRIVRWPSWPPSSKCVQKCMDILKKNLTACSKCSTTNKLRVMSPHTSMSNEKKALSTWLDFLYKSSTFSSAINRHRRMHPFERASNESACPIQFSDWISQYQKWHFNISKQISGHNMTFEQQREIILKQNIRFVVVKTFDNGLADRITHLIATYLIAILTQRFLILDETWSDFHRIMQSSLAYQSETITPWLRQLDKLNSRFSFNTNRFLTSKMQTIGLDRLSKDFDYDKDFPERVLIIKSHVGSVIHMLTSPRSIYAEFLTSTLHMKPENIFGCLYHSLIVPRLSTLVDICSIKDESTQYLLQSLLSPTYPSIGIQIRVADTFMNEERPYLSNSSHLLIKYSSFFECAQNLSNGRIPPLVYLISDSIDLRLAALSRWPFTSDNGERIRVIASSKPAKHIIFTKNAQLALKMAIFETFLFSLCEIHIITTDSGFGRFPAFSSLKGYPIYSFNHWEHPVCAIGEGQVTFTRSGHQWSGI